MGKLSGKSKYRTPEQGGVQPGRSGGFFGGSAMANGTGGLGVSLAPELQNINRDDITQEMVDSGQVLWDRSMMEGENPIRPPIGAGNAPARMPKWAEGMVQTRTAADIAANPKYAVAADAAPLAEALRAAPDTGNNSTPDAQRGPRPSGMSNDAWY